LVIDRVRVLGSGPHTPAQFFWEYLPGEQTMGRWEVVSEEGERGWGVK